MLPELSSYGCDSPIAILPNEILYDIFVLSRDSDSSSSVCPSSLPVLLKNVCWHWRDLAISMPYLWSKITIDVTTLHLQSPTLLPSMFFQYSASLPFDLKICTEWSYKDLARFDTIAPLISESLTKCKSLTITVSIWHRQVTSRIFPPNITTKMPLLEKLKVYALVGEIDAPRLRNLSTAGSNELPKLLSSARRSVTYLGMTGGIPTNETLATIPHFPNIVELGLVLYEGNRPPYPRVFSAAIKRLSVTWLDTNNANPIALLDYIDMPLLEALTLRASHGFVDDPERIEFNNVDMEAVVQQSNWDIIVPNLKSLHLNHVTISLIYLRTFGIFTFNRLEELVIIDCARFTVFMQKLGDPAAFPMLKSLTMRATSVKEFDDALLPPVINDFVNVVEEKIRNGQLTYLELTFPPLFLSESNARRMYNLQEQCRRVQKNIVTS